jgi:protein gp37
MSSKFWDKGIMLVTGCQKVSPGCANCWSEKEHRMRSCRKAPGVYSPGLMTDGRFNGKVQFNLHLLEKAAKARKPHVYAIWNDLYHDKITIEQVSQAHRIMVRAKHHAWLIITKRPEAAAIFCEGVQELLEHPAQIPPHIWHIVTCEDQKRADERIPHLLRIPGKRGVIIEPMLEDVDLRPYLPHPFNREPHCPWCEDCIPNGGVSDYWKQRTEDNHDTFIHQVILGGETGKNARPMHPDWARSIRDQCVAAAAPFYFKAWGEWKEIINQAGGSYVVEADEPETFYHTPIKTIDRGKYERFRWVDGTRMLRVGKKTSGRLLDDREHNDLAWRKS